MKIKINLIPILVVALFILPCFTSYVLANDPPTVPPVSEWETNNNTLDPSAGTGAIECEAMDENGVFTGYHKNMQDTNNIITDTTSKPIFNKEEMSENERKSAIKNWIESLWNETPDVVIQGYEDGNITRVLRSHINFIPYKELIGKQWVPCDSDDIGAERF